MNCVEQLYTSARWFCLWDVFPSEKIVCNRVFEELLLSVDPKSSPGYPYVWNGVTTNRQVMDNPVLVEQVRHKFNFLMNCLRRGEQLPQPTVRIFVKPEPHKVEKIRQGRYRLIWALPLEYQLVHRYFFGPSLAAELKNFETIPTKVGMSWARGGAHRIYKSLDDGSEEIADVDKKGWDISCAAWTQWMDCEVRLRLCLNLNPIWDHCVRACYQSLLRSRVIFSDGTVLEQVEDGIVRSGSMITISGNSRMQVILKVLFCVMELGGFVDAKHRVIAIGDDTLERLRGVPARVYQEWLSKYGYTCKEIEIGKLADRTFCSHKFLNFKGAQVPVPVNWDKHCYALTVKERSKMQYYADQCFSLMLEYCFDDEKFRQLRSEVVRVKPAFAYSQDYFQTFMLGLESEQPLPVYSDEAIATMREDPLCRTLVMLLDTSKNSAMPHKIPLVGVHPNPGPQSLRWWVFVFALLFLQMAGADFVLSTAESACFSTQNYTVVFETATFAKIRAIQKEANAIQLASGALGQAVLGTVISNEAHLSKSFYDSYKRHAPKYKPHKGKKLPHQITADTETKPFQTRYELPVPREIGHLPAREIVIAKPTVTNLVTATETMPAKRAKSGGPSDAYAKALVGKVERAVRKSRPRLKRGKPSGSAGTAFQLPQNGATDRQTIRGHDFVTPLFFTGPASAGQQILEGPGQVIYKTQLNPFKLVANSRLRTIMRLWEKFRIRKLQFEIRSVISNSNAGTVLLVYEPNPLEVTPEPTLGQDAPDTRALSKYEAHSNVKIVSVTQKTDRESGKQVPVMFDVNTKLQIGPFGGWFDRDELDIEPLQNTSIGQFFIMVQGAMNCLGSAATGAYTANQNIKWADLIVHYTVDCSVASDELDEDADDPVMSIGVFDQTTGDAFDNPFNLPDEVWTDWDDVGFIGHGSPWPGEPQNGLGLSFTYYPSPSVTRLRIQTYLGNPLNEYGMFIVLENTSLGTAADLGSTATGWLAPGTYSSVQSLNALSGTNAANCLRVGVVAILGPSEPIVLNMGAWTVGTGGSATVGSTCRWQICATAVPYNLFNALDMKKVAAGLATRPMLARDLSRWRRSQLKVKRAPSIKLLRAPLESKDGSGKQRAVDVGAECKVVKSPISSDTDGALREPRGADQGWVKVPVSDDRQPAVALSQGVVMQQERGPIGSQTSGIRDSSGPSAERPAIFSSWGEFSRARLGR